MTPRYDPSRRRGGFCRDQGQRNLPRPRGGGLHGCHECFDADPMLTGAVLTPFVARLTGRFGARALVITGLAAMTAGLTAMALLPSPAPVAVLSALMIATGLAGPLVM